MGCYSFCSYFGLYEFFLTYVDVFMLMCSNTGSAVLDIHSYEGLFFYYLQWKVDEMFFHVAPMLLLMSVQIRCTYMWYTCNEYGHLVYRGCICCGCLFVG
jgi:hypothetical protein